MNQRVRSLREFISHFYDFPFFNRVYFLSIGDRLFTFFLDIVLKLALKTENEEKREMISYEEYQELLRQRLERIRKAHEEYKQPSRPLRTAAGRYTQAYLNRIDSVEWKELKERLMREREGKCERCRRTNVVLELHHIHYETVGYERDTDLSLLCEICHRAADAERAERTRFDRGVNTYATKKYGDDYRAWPEDIDEEFDSWRERKRSEW